MAARTFPESSSSCSQLYSGNVSVNAIKDRSVDGRFSKEISIKTCPQKVTGNNRVVNWSEYQNKWPHLTQCSFAKPANDGVVDLLIGIDNSELHYSQVDLQGKMVDLSPGSDHSVGAVLVRPKKRICESTIPRYPYLVHTGASMERKKKGSCCDVDNSLKRFWETEKSGTDSEDRLVLTEEERLALNKSKILSSMKMEGIESLYLGKTTNPSSLTLRH